MFSLCLPLTSEAGIQRCDIRVDNVPAVNQKSKTSVVVLATVSTFARYWLQKKAKVPVRPTKVTETDVDKGGRSQESECFFLLPTGFLQPTDQKQ